MTRALRLTVALPIVAAGLSTAGAPVPVTAAPAFGFAKPIVIDPGRAGGEPIVYVDRKGTWMYSPHAGTTHFYKQGALAADQFLVPYRGETYIYRCTAGSASCASTPGSWQYVDLLGTGLHSVGSGFSDPDFTEDTAGTLYHAEINLVQTTVNHSTDDGISWTANVTAPAGDRPWLAADGPGVVYLSIDPSGGVHTVYKSTDSGASFSSGVGDDSTLPDGRDIQGNGKLIVDPRTHVIYEPAWVHDSNGNIAGVGVGVSKDGGATFTQHLAANDTVYRTFWGMVTEDRAGTLYLLWDQADSASGYSSEHPVAIRYSYSKDGGVSWSAARDISRPGVSVFWPWASGGAAGTLGVAWYQSDAKAIIESESSNIGIEAAQITGADTPTPSISIANATGGPTHIGTVCQDGTACNVQAADDRRLGEYLTTSFDPAGRMIIAYSDTVLYPNSPVSRPGLVVQNAGPGFLGGPPVTATGGGATATAAGAGATPNTGRSAAAAGWLIAATGVTVLLVAPVRRRRRWRR